MPARYQETCDITDWPQLALSPRAGRYMYRSKTALRPAVSLKTVQHVEQHFPSAFISMHGPWALSVPPGLTERMRGLPDLGYASAGWATDQPARAAREALLMPASKVDRATRSSFFLTGYISYLNSRGQQADSTP